MTTMTAQTTQVYSIFIKASPEQIWDAITKPEFTQKYMYGIPVTVTRQRFDGGQAVQGGVLEYEPPHRLVHAWQALYDPDTAGEPESRWPEIRESYERLRPLAVESLVAIFQIVMTETVEKALEREISRLGSG